MKLKHIAISNFKGIQADNLSPESFTCLVGENNAGKSSVMQAICWRRFKIEPPCRLNFEPGLLANL